MQGDVKWRRVQEWIAAGIRSGRWPVGSTLPAATELAPLVLADLELTADPNTIRKAVRGLRDLRVLRTVPGAGTYVDALPPEALPEPSGMTAVERRLLTRIARLEARVEQLERGGP